ncbi:MAG: MarR family winged helix-turn-helix transcriptional regulator [Nitrospira sp.]|nr:MarR family winged helix-turn-helix transcriptional regulator [Nitrospira sp.]
MPPLPCACATLRRAARVVTQLYDDELRGAGLRVTQFTLLQALGETGKITQGRLGETLGLDSTTLSRTLKLLEKEGWIQDTPGTDRREHYWQLTPAGQQKLEQTLPYWARAQQRFQNSLGGSDWKKLQAIFDGITRAAVQA